MPKNLIFSFAASSTCINFFQDLIRGLSMRSPVHIIAGKDHAYDDLVVFSKHNLINLIDIDLPRKINTNLLQAYRSISNKIKGIDSQLENSIIFSNTPIMSFLIALFRLFNSQVTHIHFCHGLYSYNQRPHKRLFFRVFEQITFFLSDEIIFVSNSLSEYAKNNYFIESRKIQSINSIVGVDIPNTNKMRNFQFRIGFFGRICFDKGFEDFCALSKILPEHFSYVIAGPIDEEKYKDQLYVPDKKIEYMGIIKDRADFFNNIDLLFFPSRREGFGVSIIESSAHGIPTIAYDIVGVSDSLHDGVNGFKVSFRDINAAALIIKSLAENHNVLQKLKLSSIDFVQKYFSREIVLNRNLTTLNELL